MSDIISDGDGHRQGLEWVGAGGMRWCFLHANVFGKLAAAQQRIQQLEADLSRTVAALKDFHSRLVKLDNFAKFQTAQLEEQVNIKILEQSNRIQ